MSRTRIDQVIEVHARSAAILPADILTELIPAVQDLVLHRVRQPAACAYVPAGDVLIRLAVEIVAMFYAWAGRDGDLCQMTCKENTTGLFPPTFTMLVPSLSWQIFDS